MKLSVIGFTESGIGLAQRLAEQLKETMDCEVYGKCTYAFQNGKAGNVQAVECSVSDWAGAQMKKKQGLLFIGACGIAIRAVAPHLTDKLHDSPVLVMDEKGRYVIPILSGHMGGANALAGLLAGKTGAEPVLTTATDLNGRFAVDVFAGKNQLWVTEKSGIARVSAKVLSGQEIRIAIEPGHLQEEGRLPEGVVLMPYPPRERVDVVISTEKGPFDTTLLLRPRAYVLGVGCRKGKEEEALTSFIRNNLEALGIAEAQVAAVASIAQKKEEPGILAWSRRCGVPFVTYTAEELNGVAGTFHTSAFVKASVGVDNVCERAALKACGGEGRLLCPRRAGDGMTLAVAGKNWRVRFDET